MDGSMMFIVYPSTSNGVTVSLRTASGHDTPGVLNGPNILVRSSQINNGVMTANVLCYNCTSWTGGRGLTIQDNNQPWIWATGPGQAQGSNNQDAEIEKHAKYGTFFVDMPKTLTSSAVTPAISGTSNINTKALPGSFAILVIIHAICLGGAFVLLFPIGVVILRWFGSVRFHWVLQVFAAFVSIIGLVVAIALSIMDPLYQGLDEGHQIIGIVVVAALFVQAALGYVHHINYKKQGGRTWSTYVHLWTGRVVIVIGMLNAVLGFELVDNIAAAAGAGVVSVLILIGLVATTYFGAKRMTSKTMSEPQHFDHVPLRNYDLQHGESQEALYYDRRQ